MLAILFVSDWLLTYNTANAVHFGFSYSIVSVAKSQLQKFKLVIFNIHSRGILAQLLVAILVC